MRILFFNKINLRMRGNLYSQFAESAKDTVDTKQLLAQVAEDQETRRYKKVMSRLVDRVDKGSTLGEAISLELENGDTFVQGLVDQGETKAALTDVFTYLKLRARKHASSKSALTKIFTLPIIYMVVLFFVASLYSIFVIPQFVNMYSGFGADLPALTKLVFGMTDVLAKWWWFLLLGVVLLYATKKFPVIKTAFGYLYINLPITGVVHRENSFLQYIELFLLLIKCDVTPIEAANRANAVIKNEYLHNKLQKIIDDLDKNDSLSSILLKLKILPKSICRKLQFTETVQQQSTILQDYFVVKLDQLEERADMNLGLITLAFNVCILMILGIFIISMYLPIFKLGQVV